MGRIGTLLLAVAGLAGAAWAWSRGGVPPLPGLVLALGAFVAGAAAVSGLGLRRAWSRRQGPRRSASDAAELATLRLELEQARSELDAIHSSVSHDLRSPIGAALNFLTVLEEDHGGQLDADGRAILVRVRRSADSALALLDGLARLARVGRKPMTPRLVDVDGLVRTAFVAARPAERAIELHVEGSLPPVVGDPDLLRTAFGELLANAVRFTSRREKAVVGVAARRDGDGVIDYRVTDDGVGFDPRFAGKLFHVFERLHSREDFPGAGAGLAVVRRIAERHGGSVRAEGVPGSGATFHLTLPAAPDVTEKEMAS